MSITVNEDYRLRKLADKVASCNSILDIGCSQLPNIHFNNKNVTGLDIKPAILPSNYSDFIEGNLDDIIKDNSTFDGIVAGELIEHLIDPIGFLKKCHQTLKPGGLLVLSTPNPHSPIEIILNAILNKKFFYTKDHIMIFPQRWLIRMLEVSGFQNVSLFSAGFPVPKIGLIPCPLFLCHQTIAVAQKECE